MITKPFSRHRGGLVRPDGAPEAAHAAADMRPIPGAGPDIGEDYESTGAVAWREFKRALHSYFEPALSLTPAGKFWIGYVLGLLSALLMPHWLA